MGTPILREILQEVKEAKCFTVMADETRDISNQEQLVVCIRWVNKTYKVCEDPIGTCEHPKDRCCNNPHGPRRYLNQVWPSSGTLSGPRIWWSSQYDGLFEWCGCTDPERSSSCFIHPLLSTLSEPCAAGGWQDSEPIRDALDLVREAARLIRWSPKQKASFPEKQLNATREGSLQWHSDSKPKNPSPLSYTTWTSAHWCHQCCAAELWDAAGNIWGHSQINTWPKRNTAGGMVSLVDNFSTFFALKLSHHVFDPAELASKTLQAMELNSQEGRLALNTAEIFY